MAQGPALSSRLQVLLAVVALAGCGVLVAVVISLAGPGGKQTPQAPGHTPAAHSVTYDDYSFLIDGKRTYLWSGEFHYFRLPSPDLWRDIFQKMKAAGFNATSLYFDWGYHSPAPGVYDFNGVRDVDRLLDMAAEAGLYVIARPGPYINAEVDGGGFPGWLSTSAGRTRSADPDYLKYSDEWQTRIDRIIARHQLTTGDGSVIAYQVENEYYHDNAAGRVYLRHLEQKARADGITVPLTGNHKGKFNSGDAALDVDGADAYPQGFDCTRPVRWKGVPDISYADAPGKPLYTPEFQGGAFDPWGGPGYDKCARLINGQFANVFYKQNIAVGATAQSLYMVYGGTSWGWLSRPQNYTSYDYGAAIRETRQLDPKFYQDKLIGYFTQAVAPLTKTDALRTRQPDNAAIIDTARRNPDTGTEFHVLRHRDSTSTGVDRTHIALDGRGANYPAVPQEPGTAITVDGRDSHVIVADYKLGTSELRYSTSEILTNADIGGRDIAVLYGRAGTDGETVLHFGEKPRVTVIGGRVRTVWDATSGDLRLDYRHHGLARVMVRSRAQASRPLLLLLADTGTAHTFWRQDTGAGAVLVRGTHLLRGASQDGATLRLTGDNADDPHIEVFTEARKVRWNGRSVSTSVTPTGSLAGRIPIAKPVRLPALTGWRRAHESPEAEPTFDDSHWAIADKRASNSTTAPASLPVLFADDYGFHTGNTWYRGRFRATGRATGIHLVSDSGGGAQAFSVWVNGVFLGSSTTGSGDFPFPSRSVSTTGRNVVSVLTVNMGHEEDYQASNGNRAARGLLGANLIGDQRTSITWRLQGVRSGESLKDTTRGPLSTGGLFGERAGWSLPGYPDSSWARVSLPARDTTPGVSWYRTEVTLDLPRRQDSSLGLTITDNPNRRYRAMLFVNGWQVGNYVNYVGPENSFPIPNGVLDPYGVNTLAIAVWNLDGRTGGLGKVEMTRYGSYASSLLVHRVVSPGYGAASIAAAH